MTTPTEALAEDYTACGVALIGMNLGGGGTARVNVYCELPVNHDGNHAAAIEWEDPPHVVRIAQGSERLSAARVAAAHAELVAEVIALADDFYERGQSHVLATDASRAYRDAWTTAARKVRAAVADPEPQDPPNTPSLTAERIARLHGVPMSLIDGRPWVPREDEQPDDPAPNTCPSCALGEHRCTRDLAPCDCRECA